MSERLIPTAASRWTKDTLEALNACYDRRDVYEFIFDDRSMPSGLKEGMSPTQLQVLTSTQRNRRLGGGISKGQRV